jgi:hypothetical protein
MVAVECLKTKVFAAAAALVSLKVEGDERRRRPG